METIPSTVNTQTKVKPLALSLSSVTGRKLATFEIEYQRYITAEVNTHRVLSKNSASSRAIPTARALSYEVAKPDVWTYNQSGMQGYNIMSAEDAIRCDELWMQARDSVVEVVNEMTRLYNPHKQHINRLLEPWQMMKTVITGTEWDNFLELRNHPDAQPEFYHLAHQIEHYLDNGNFTVLEPGQWHLPYVETRLDKGVQKFYNEGIEISLEQAQRLSISCCAQVSYRNENRTQEKADELYKLFAEATPIHASPFEHAATPIDYIGIAGCNPKDLRKLGITGSHFHKDGSVDYKSGNLHDWIQYRHLYL